ncbi:MAG: hypothetical protein FWC43_00990 [Planctomycetaceae bacterium]|nr:hypothetical protein [Planctomycetaceae bacterium]
MKTTTNTMTDILNEIVARRRLDVEAKTVSLEEWKARHRDRGDFRAFHQSLKRNRRRPGMAAVIAEIKRGSPAKGLFAPDLAPAERAYEYEGGGATCLSVLTEPHYFYGSFEDLITARNACGLPVLQKDFIVTEYQVYEAAVHADCLLLIARCLERQQLADLHGLATELGLDVLVEVFDEEDIDKIEPFHFPLIGVNNRNLRTMSIDLENSQRLFSRFASDQTIVAASGVKTRDDIEQFMQAGIRAFLVGESLSVQTEPLELLLELVEGKGLFSIKICGISTPETAVACFEAGASMIGFVHYPPSPRHVDVTKIREILDAVEPFLSEAGREAVLVVVDQLPDEIDSRITYLQVYGNIAPEELDRDDIPPYSIQVARSDGAMTRILYSGSAGSCGCRKPPYLAVYFGESIHPVSSTGSCRCQKSPTLYTLEISEGAMPGGNGITWDWSIARPFCERYPTLIAGGVTPENVAEVIRLANPYGVDVSSGVESSPGVKDIDKVKRLIENVHQAIIRRETANP